jgi:Mn2+/Fe2+ NRAMP family transporter
MEMSSLLQIQAKGPTECSLSVHWISDSTANVCLIVSYYATPTIYYKIIIWEINPSKVTLFIDVLDIIHLPVCSILSLFWKNKSRLMRSPCNLCVCVCVSVYPPHQLLNAWTNLCETWYVCHGTWAYLDGVLHKSLLSVCVSVCVCCWATAR